MSVLASETQNKVTACRAALHNVEKHLDPLLAKSVPEVGRKLAPLENAELQVGLAYTVASLYFCHLLTQGVDPSEHPIRQELDRIQLYFKKVRTTAEEVRDKQAESTRLRIDSEAAQRIVQHYTAAADAHNQQLEGQRSASASGMAPHPPQPDAGVLDGPQRKRRKVQKAADSAVDVTEIAENADARDTQASDAEDATDGVAEGTVHESASIGAQSSAVAGPEPSKLDLPAPASAGAAKASTPQSPAKPPLSPAKPPPPLSPTLDAPPPVSPARTLVSPAKPPPQVAPAAKAPIVKMPPAGRVLAKPPGALNAPPPGQAALLKPLATTIPQGVAKTAQGPAAASILARAKADAQRAAVKKKKKKGQKSLAKAAATAVCGAEASASPAPAEQDPYGAAAEDPYA